MIMEVGGPARGSGEGERAQPLDLGLVLPSLSLITPAGVISRHENDNRLLELVVFLATIAATIGDLSQLDPSTGEVAFLQIALAEDLAELARVVADQIEHPRLLLILDVCERVERCLVLAFVGKGARFVVGILLGERRGMAVDARLRLAAPHQTGPAAHFDAALFRGAVLNAGRAFALALIRFALSAGGRFRDPTKSASAKARLAARASPSMSTKAPSQMGKRGAMLGDSKCRVI